MLYFAASRVADVAPFFDASFFWVVEVHGDSDLHKIAIVAAEDDDGRSRILLIRGILRLYAYANEDHLRLFKIFVFDALSPLFRVNLDSPLDLVWRNTGVWTRRDISRGDLLEKVESMNMGLLPSTV